MVSCAVGFLSYQRVNHSRNRERGGAYALSRADDGNGVGLPLRSARPADLQTEARGYVAPARNYSPKDVRSC